MAGPRKSSKPDHSGKTGRPITEERWQKFLDLLAETANVTRSCEASGISRMSVYNRKRDDPEFTTRYDEAYRRGYEALEEECQRRAFSGFEEPVFYKGKKVATVTKFSDTLAVFLMKGNTEGKFRERVETTSGSPAGGRFAKLTDEEIEAELKRRLG